MPSGGTVDAQELTGPCFELGWSPALSVASQRIVVERGEVTAPNPQALPGSGASNTAVTSARKSPRSGDVASCPRENTPCST